MAAGREDVDRWIETGKVNGSMFILSVCDTFDCDDYPIYCKDKKELYEQHQEHNARNMQRINEVIMIEDGIVTEDLSINSPQIMNHV